MKTEKIDGENMTTEELIDYVNFTYSDETVRCRILLAVVLKRLEKVENGFKGIHDIRKDLYRKRKPKKNIPRVTQEKTVK